MTSVRTPAIAVGESSPCHSSARRPASAPVSIHEVAAHSRTFTEVMTR